MTGVLIRGERFGKTHRRKREVQMKTEAETGVM